jgi:hypothetical protein
MDIHKIEVRDTKPKEVMVLHADGRITVSEDASPTETALLVISAMEKELKHMIDAAYARGYQDGYAANENGHEHE